VGITEHMPSVGDRFRLSEEIRDGLTAKTMYERFVRYISECRRLQSAYAGRIALLVGIEGETYTGSLESLEEIVPRFRPDYVVGSVHHVDDICFDEGPETYGEAIRHCGGIESLYCRYFDLQHEMLSRLKPSVVGHFDVIRIFDPDYGRTILEPEIWARICRNLELIRDLGLVLDFNVRALAKGAGEPYVSRPILLHARDLGIPAVPGDDSHGVETVGLNVDRGIRILEELGFETRWPMPRIYDWHETENHS
jgi:histidinol-phosphatase (PHP family)